MRLVSALLVRNEAAPDRYLRRVLECCAGFSDQILVLDDGSTDGTAELAASCPKTVVKHRTHIRGLLQTKDSGAWGKEAPARKELWERGATLAKDGWLLIVDADMILVGDPRPLCLSWEVNAWAWPLVDLWDSETTFRVDGPWAGGPQMPRPWLFRPSAANDTALMFGPPDAIGRKAWTPQWNDRGIHVGHCPGNFPLICGIAPAGIYWKHFAYMRPEHREAKFKQYMAVSDQLSPFELEHATSILDATGKP